MDIGKTKICGVTYVFDENGKWTGRVGKSGLCPEDFSLNIKLNLGGSGFSSDGTIYYGETVENGMYSADVKISNRDRQIIYCMLVESNAVDNSEKLIDYDYYSNRVFEYIPEEFGIEETEPASVYTINANVDGESYEFVFNLDAYQIVHFDQDALDVSFLYESVQSFCNWLYDRNKPDSSVEMLTFE